MKKLDVFKTIKSIAAKYTDRETKRWEDLNRVEFDLSALLAAAKEFPDDVIASLLEAQ